MSASSGSEHEREAVYHEAVWLTDRNLLLFLRIVSQWTVCKTRHPHGQ